MTRDSLPGSPASSLPAPGDDPADRQFARTLANGIDILLAYRPGEALLGNRDFVQRTGLSKSTVARLTHTLAVLGYLRHEAALGKYRLGAPVLAPATRCWRACRSAR